MAKAIDMRLALAPAAALATFLVTSGVAGCSIGLTAHLPEVTLEVTPGTQGRALALLGEQPVAAQDVSQAKSVQLEAISFTALSAGTFDFVSSAHVWLAADGLPDIEVAGLDSVPAGSTAIALTAIPDTDLLPYLKAGCSLRIEVTAVVPDANFSYSGELQASVGI